MDQTFDARFEFHKRTVIHHVDNFAGVSRADWEFRFDVVPRVRQQLLETKRDLDLFPVDVENHDFEFLVHRHHLRRMRNSSVRHVGDMEKTIDAAKIDERTEVGDVLDDTFADLTLFQLFHQLLLRVRTLFFDQ